MKPILRNVPVPIITNRLELRPPRAGDGALILPAIEESRETLKPWMTWADAHKEVADSEEWARRSAAKFLLREDLTLAIIDRETGLWAGATGFHRIEWERGKFEIGYWLRARFVGRGYMTETVAALTRFAFAELKAVRLEIRTDRENLRSAAVPRRLGFVHEATLEKEGFRILGSDEPRDTYIFRRFDAENVPEVGARWQSAAS